MFSQLFGKYLVEQSVFSQDVLDMILAEQSNARVKLGTIAVAEGLLTEAQAEEINHLQTQMDKRFGDIAVENHYLTDAQVGTLLRKQGNATMKFYQLLADKANMSMTDIDDHLAEFQGAYGFADSEMEALKEEDVDKLIPLFAATMNSSVTTIAGLVLKNITRFVTSNFYPERMRKAKEYDYMVLAGQITKGDKFIYLGFAANSDMSGIVELAKGYARGTTITGSDEVYDAVCEFANLNDGLFASEESKNEVSIDMLPPSVYLRQKVTGSLYIMPIVINGKPIDMIISVDEGIKVGDTVHKVEIKKTAVSTANSNSKGNIMIVDDSTLIRKMLRALLEKNGYNVVAEAANGAEAVELYETVRPDVVTLDITMPVMDGVEALRQIKSKWPESKAIMITAAGQKDKIVEALKLGAAQFIMKPFNDDEVVKNFEQVLK